VSTPRSLQRPDGVERVEISIGGRTWAALRAAPDPLQTAGRAPAVLLVHGFTGSKEDFASLLPELADHGYDAIAIDHAGQHESQHESPPEGGPLSIDDFARDILTVVGGLDADQVHLVGHSFGGLAARRAALSNPDALSSLTLLNSGPTGVIEPGQQQALLAFVGAMRAGMVDTVWAYMESERRTENPAIDDEVVRFVEQRFRSGHVDAHTAIAQALLDEGDLVPDLAVLPLDVHVVYGVDDDVWPEHVQQDMAARLGTPAHAIPGAGHSPGVDDPRLTAQTLHKAWSSSTAEDEA
jgi:pimeloyl-ACP methyl ester carboxylesterase